jgi:6-phospho-beta-glucosidase
VAIGFQRHLAELLEVTPEDVTLGHVGLNHLTWERSATVHGVDRLPELIAKHGDVFAEHLELPAELLRLTGTLPSYYLRYFYCHDEVVAEERVAQPRGARVAEIERELLAMYQDPALDTNPALLSERGGAYYSEAAIGLLAALHGTPGTHAVNVRNNGTLPNLSDDAVIEVTCGVDADGATPTPVAPLAPDLAGLVSHVSAYEELAVDAALRGGADRVFHALLAHPLVGQADKARTLTDTLLAANAKFLAWAR